MGGWYNTLMKQRFTDYTIVIEKEKRIGTNRACYTVFVPILGIATEADSIEEAKKAAKSLIEFHLQCLTEEGEKIPIEASNSFITKTGVALPENAALAC